MCLNQLLLELSNSFLCIAQLLLLERLALIENEVTKVFHLRTFLCGFVQRGVYHKSLLFTIKISKLIQVSLAFPELLHKKDMNALMERAKSMLAYLP